MTYHFYNSFNLGAGYSHADYIDGRPTATRRKLPHELDLDYKNGGCVMALRACDNIAYLLVKKILYTNRQKTFTQQGRTVNINFSIETSRNELNRLCMITIGILSEWKNFCRRLGDIITIPAIDGNEYNYSINPAELEQLVNGMEKVGRSARKLPLYGDALRNPQRSDAVLLVPIKTESYYASNASSLELDDKRYKRVRWSCVIPASRSDKEPDMFEQLTQSPMTADYDMFLNNLGVDGDLSHSAPILQQTAQTVNTDKNQDDIPPSSEEESVKDSQLRTDEPPLAKEKETQPTENALADEDASTAEKPCSSTDSCTDKRCSLASFRNRQMIRAAIYIALGIAVGFTVARLIN